MHEQFEAVTAEHKALNNTVEGLERDLKRERESVLEHIHRQDALQRVNKLAKNTNTDYFSAFTCKQDLSCNLITKEPRTSRRREACTRKTAQYLQERRQRLLATVGCRYQLVCPTFPRYRTRARGACNKISCSRASLSWDICSECEAPCSSWRRPTALIRVAAARWWD